MNFNLLFVCFSSFIHIFTDPNNRYAPTDPPTHYNDGRGYTITPTRLAELRSNFLYWFFDKGGSDNIGDLQSNIHASNPQLHKNFNFQLPFYGFRFNYSRVSFFFWFSFVLRFVPNVSMFQCFNVLIFQYFRFQCMDIWNFLIHQTTIHIHYRFQSKIGQKGMIHRLSEFSSRNAVSDKSTKPTMINARRAFISGK